MLEGELSLLVFANSATDIAAALRLQREFRCDLAVDSATEAYPLAEIRAAGVAVLVSADEPRAHRVVETAARLAEADIPCLLRTGLESYVPNTCCFGKPRSPPPTGSAARGCSKRCPWATRASSASMTGLA